jgi:hypothetical protein
VEEEEVKKEVEGLALLKDDGLGDKSSAPTLNSLIQPGALPDEPSQPI